MGRASPGGRRRQDGDWSLGCTLQKRKDTHPQAIMNQAYLDAVRLLLAAAPVIFRKPTFALKGGTAINLFARDMPRLSVDLDLVYTDHQAGRDAALAAISSELLTLQGDLNALGFLCEMGLMSEGSEVKLFCPKRPRTHQNRGQSCPSRHHSAGSISPLGIGGAESGPSAGPLFSSCQTISTGQSPSKMKKQISTFTDKGLHRSQQLMQTGPTVADTR